MTLFCQVMAALCVVNIKEALFNGLKTLRPSDKRRFFYQAAAPSANEKHISGSCITEMNLFPFSQEPFSAGLRIADEVAHQTVARGSLLRSWITALHAPRGAVIGGWGVAGGTAQMQKKMDSVGPSLLSQAEPRSLCSILSLPPPHLQNKEAERKEEASLQVELRTDAPGSSRLMQGRLHCAEPRCFCIQ